MDTRMFSSFLKEMRVSKGLTQQQLAEKLSVTDKAISKWERGLSLPDVELFPRLASFLGVTISEMYNAQRKNTKSSDISNEYPVEDKADEAEPVSVHLTPSGRYVSPLLFGNNLEHTRGSVYSGLSAEMIRNRKFAGKPTHIGCAMDWYPIGEKVHLSISSDPYTSHLEPEKMRRINECYAQRIHNLFNISPCGIGQHGLCLKKDQRYTFEIVMRADQPTNVEIALSQNTTGTPYEKVFFEVENREWKTYSAAFSPCVDDENADITITFDIVGAITIGAVSLLPDDHFHGMRRDVVDLLKETGVSVLRWPGGNFAGEYRWKDGLLPRNQRGPLQAYAEIETQPWSHGYDFHEINTDDFIALCKEIGALPFITVNPAWDSPEECAQWVEYCNGDSTTEYGKMRIERGFTEPYNVVIWSLGNEFGYGHMEGANTPSDYSMIVRKCAEAMKKVTDNITFVSSGPYPNELWSDYSALPLSDIAPAVSYHHYTRYLSAKNANEDVNFSVQQELKQAYLAMINDTKCVKEDIETIRRQTKNQLKICFD